MFYLARAEQLDKPEIRCLRVDDCLLQIIDSTKAWRDAWSAILTYQSRLMHEFEGLYAPIIGSSDPASSRPGVPTPPETLSRTNKLHEEYEDLQKDLLVEVNAVDDRMIRPAQQAKDLLAPMKKTIKKREDKKVRSAVCIKHPAANSSLAGL